MRREKTDEVGGNERNDGIGETCDEIVLQAKIKEQ